MKKIEPVSNQLGEGGYFLCEDPEGVLRCSCGSMLIKQDNNNYKCAGGYPEYRFEDGEVIFDKFGNVLLASKPHDQSQSKENVNKQLEGKDTSMSSNKREDMHERSTRGRNVKGGKMPR